MGLSRESRGDRSRFSHRVERLRHARELRFARPVRRASTAATLAVREGLPQWTIPIVPPVTYPCLIGSSPAPRERLSAHDLGLDVGPPRRQTSERIVRGIDRGLCRLTAGRRRFIAGNGLTRAGQVGGGRVGRTLRRLDFSDHPLSSRASGTGRRRETGRPIDYRLPAEWPPPLDPSVHRITYVRRGSSVASRLPRTTHAHHPPMVLLSSAS